MKSQKTNENAESTRKYTLQVEEDETLALLPPANTKDADESLAQCQQPQESRSDEQDESDESRFVGAAALSVVLGQLIGYFSGRADVDDVDMLSFSLHHIFCRVDFLYRTAFPTLQSSFPSTAFGSPEELLRYRHMWLQLRAMKRSLNRLEPLCQLLNDASECILDALDSSNKAIPLAENVLEQDWLQSLNQERWDYALTTLVESLRSWQKGSDLLNLLTQQFSLVAPTTRSLPELDSALTILLDSAGAIFGDILPGFQAISAGDDEAMATLFFDLMQQADQLLIQCDRAREPLQSLIELFPTDLKLS